MDAFSELISRVQCPSPAFRIWVEAAADEDIRLIIDALLMANAATDETDALDYLNGILKNQQPTENLSAGDLFGNGSSHHNAMLKLKEILGARKETTGGAAWRLHGIKGHQAIPALLAGELDEQLERVPLAKRIPDILRSLMPALRDTNTSYFYGKTGMTEELFGLVKQIFKKEASEVLIKADREKNAHMLLVSMMSWARAIIFYLRRRQAGENMPVLFREVAALPRHQGIHAGIIDCIRVARIRGKKPGVKERKILGSLASKKPPSVIHLYEAIKRIFPGAMQYVFTDWKFAVGDGIPTSGNFNPVITLPQISDGPLRKHHLQMLRYLAMSSLGLHILTGQNPAKWTNEAVFTRGEIVYFLPEKVITHRINATPDELEHFAKTQVALKLASARSRAMIRQSSNTILCHLAAILNGNRRGKRKGPNSCRQLPLINSHTTIVEIVEGMRTFADPWRIIEESGGKYHLHYGQLLKKIEEGKVRQKENFLPEEGGLVHCVFSDHADRKSPSLHLKPHSLDFFCYGCGRGGKIKKHSIPSELGIEISAEQRNRRCFSRLATEMGRQTPTKEHIRIMSDAQIILRGAFWRSPAETYLREERAIDPGLAFELGAGFGSNEIINGLLDMGYSYDQLIFYGFVGISRRISTNFGLSPLLKKRGMSITEIRRECGKDKKTRHPLYGFPYCALAGRVTFPLDLDGKINNFYGRSVIPNAVQAHQKLTKKFTKIPHGIFNSQAIAGCANRKIVMVEAVIDALSLIQLGQSFDITCGCDNTIGVIGTLNYNTIAALLQSGIEALSIAYDLDESDKDAQGKETGESGQRATARIAKQFQEHEKALKISNFTEEFYREHPEIEPAKDWNDLLIRMRKH